MQIKHRNVPIIIYKEVKLKYNIILEHITEDRMSVYRLNFKKKKIEKPNGNHRGIWVG